MSKHLPSMRGGEFLLYQTEDARLKEAGGANYFDELLARDGSRQPWKGMNT